MKLEYVTTRGDILSLVGNDLFYLTNFDEQTAVSTSISSSVIGGADGDTVNSIRANPRTIVLDLQIKSAVNVEDAKRAILQIVKLKQRGILRWTQNEKTVDISGIVENIELSRWKKSAVMQITLYCEQPFWEDDEDIVQQINESVDLHYFTASPSDMLYFLDDGIPLGTYDTIRTKTFYNDGDVDVGLEITILAHDTVTNPIIYDANGNYFGIGYDSESESGGAGLGTAWSSKPFVMQAGDNVVITTHKGNKTVKYNGTVIFDKIKPQSTWLQLQAGVNQYSINSDDDSITNMSFSLIYRQRYV